MADLKYPTLKALFTAICDSIRKKDGTTELINHQDLPEHIEALPSGGDRSIENSLVDGSVVVYINYDVKSTNANAFRGYTNLRTVEFGEISALNSNTFYGCTNLVSSEFTNLKWIGSNTFYNCTEFVALVIDGDDIPTLAFTNAFIGTPIEQGKGWIYVKRANVEALKTMTNWAVYSEQIVALEDYKLQIVAQPTDIIANIGDSVKLEVVAMAIGAKYQWQYSTDGGKTWVNNTATGYNTSTFTFNMANAANGRLYRCVIQDKYGAEVISDAVTITIATSDITITSQPADVTVSAGEMAQFSVEAISDNGLKLSYQWQYLNASSAWTDVTSASGQNYNTDTVSIEATAARNGRKFRCVITDTNGNSIISDEAIMTVA